MATATRTYGPEMHGRRMTYEEFVSAPWREGNQYELINGRVFVAPLADLGHGRLDRWIDDRLNSYKLSRPDVLNYVLKPARVFVSSAFERATCPEPDVAAYYDFPIDVPFDELDWRDISPILVVEILSNESALKDLDRNVKLYALVPSIKEYWIVDPRESADRPSLIVYRRRGRGWQKPIHVPYRGIYTTKLLPGFSLVVDPHAK